MTIQVIIGQTDDNDGLVLRILDTDDETDAVAVLDRAMTDHLIQSLTNRRDRLWTADGTPRSTLQ